MVTSFGLINAPATFQTYINEQLRENLNIDPTAYIDDVLIYTSSDEQDPWMRVGSILGKLDKAGLNLDVDKCESLQNKLSTWALLLEQGEARLLTHPRGI